nr:hypothetical protein [Streptomyces sp. NRRL F-5126]
MISAVARRLYASSNHESYSGNVTDAVVKSHFLAANGDLKALSLFVTFDGEGSASHMFTPGSFLSCIKHVKAILPFDQVRRKQPVALLSTDKWRLNDNSHVNASGKVILSEL